MIQIVNRRIIMKKLLTLFLFGFCIFSFDIYSDDQYEELPNVANVQVNVCKLKEGVSLKEYKNVTHRLCHNGQQKI
jgi:hypothetical protein